jgi:hypothetical protein
MERMFTPARQLDEADTLQKDATATIKVAAKDSADEKKERQQTADSIKAKDLEVHMEDDWAVTGGKYDLVAFGKHIPSRLDQAVWVYRDGQWWIYSFKPVERNAYGNPPDFAMDLDPQK